MKYIKKNLNLLPSPQLYTQEKSNIERSLLVPALNMIDNFWHDLWIQHEGNKLKKKNLTSLIK